MIAATIIITGPSLLGTCFATLLIGLALWLPFAIVRQIVRDWPRDWAQTKRDVQQPDFWPKIAVIVGFYVLLVLYGSWISS